MRSSKTKSNNLQDLLLRIKLLTNTIERDISSQQVPNILDEIAETTLTAKQLWSSIPSNFVKDDVQHKLYLLCKQYKNEFNEMGIYGGPMEVQRKLSASLKTQEIQSILFDVHIIEEREGCPKSYLLMLVQSITKEEKG